MADGNLIYWHNNGPVEAECGSQPPLKDIVEALETGKKVVVITRGNATADTNYPERKTHELYTE